jgi:hypothetical protein
MYLEAGIIAAASLSLVVLAGTVRRRRRTARGLERAGALDLAPARPAIPAGMKHLAIRLNVRLPISLPLPQRGAPSRRLGLLLALR